MANRDGDILKSLETLRRRVRALLALDGLSRGVAILVPAAALFLLLDWWVSFPWFVRAIVLAFGGAWATHWTWRRILRPLMAPIPLEQLALRIDALDVEKREGLASAVSFLEGHGIGAPELRDQLVTAWRERASAGEWTRGLHPRRALGAVVLAMAVVIAVVLVHREAPELAMIGRSRLLTPWTPAEWPRRVQIDPLTQDMAAAFGEGVTASMRVVRGDHEYLRAYIEWGTPGGSRRRTPMLRDTGGIYRFTIEDVRAPIEYAFVAGDDDTRERMFMIRVARRPELAGAHAVVSPPPYAAGMPPVTLTVGEEPLRVVRGSVVRIEATARRDAGAPSTVHRGELVFSDGDRFKLVANETAPSILAGDFPVDRSESFQIQLVDDSGLESRSDRPVEMIVREDEPPSVDVFEPASDIEMTARGVVDLRVRALDDFGVTGLKMVVGIDGEELVPVLDLAGDESRAMTEDADRREPATAPNVEESQADGVAAARVVDRSQGWPLRSLDRLLERGMVLELAFDAVDNFDLGGERHAPTRSSRRRIRIVSEAEFRESLRQSLTTTGAQLRRLLAELQVSRTETGRLDEGPSTGQAMSKADRERSVRLAQEIQRLAQNTREAAEKLREISRRADQNQASRLDVNMQADRLERSMTRLAEESLGDAAVALAQAAEEQAAGAQHESLAVAAAAQDRSIAEMAEMLDGLEQWNEFADIARLLRQLLDRQEELSRACVRIAVAVDGRAMDELSEPQRDSVEDAARTQNLLRDEATALIHGMTNMAASLIGTDLISAGALERAVAIGSDQGLATKMAAAAADIQQLRLRSAKSTQSAAASALRAMIAALDERPDRELAALARELAGLLEAVRELIRTQTVLEDEASDLSTAEWRSEVAERLTERQYTLARRTEAVAKRIEVTDSDGLAAQFAMLTAVAQMEAASSAIGRGDVASARVEQGAARVSLQEALDALAALQERVDRETAERSMAGILEDLTSLREMQAAIRVETEAVRTALRVDGATLKRSDKAKLKRLGDRQAALSEPLGVVSEKMTGSIVFLRVCEDLGLSIEDAASVLAEFDVESAVTLQIEIMGDLERMIRALESRPRKSEQRFVENESGGGGAGEPTMSRPVPPLAELKVLRMLQLDVNARTRVLDGKVSDSIESADAAKEQIEKLGRDQQAIHEMAKQLAGEGGIQ